MFKPPSDKNCCETPAKIQKFVAGKRIENCKSNVVFAEFYFPRRARPKMWESYSP